MKLILSLFFILSYAVQAQYVAPQDFALLNSPYDEQNPVMSPDGRTLFFTVGNHPQNAGSKRDPGDIWFSQLSGNQWSAPMHAVVLNDGAYNAVAGFSASGNQIILLSHYAGAGNVARSQGIAIATKTGSGWSKPENIIIPYFQNKSSLQSGHISNDGSVFIFSADTYGSRGAEDLYVSIKKSDGNWSEPKNLGDKINTKLQELSPSLSADGRTLYFSTNGRFGFGSFDVFSANRLDDTWTNWSEPENIGVAVNSEGRELFYKILGNGSALYTSTTNSDGYGDIKVFIPENSIKDSVVIAQVPPVDTVVSIVELVHEPVNDRLIRVHGAVTNAKTGEAIQATLVFESGDTLIPIQTNAGEFKVQLEPTSSYTIKIDAPGYVNTMEKLDMNTYEMKELEMNFKLQPIEVGTTVTLKNVLFIQSKAELLPESYPELNAVVQFLKANPHLEIELAGHTDNRGSFRQLMSLSQQRVNKVKHYLVSKGIESKRIVGKGYGGSKPIASNDTEETRMLNRRVEFVIRKL